MSVSQVSQTISAAKNDTSVEVPFDKALANLTTLANLKIGQWVKVDKNELVIQYYMTTWFWNPDNTIIELVKSSVQSVFDAMEKDKVRQAIVFSDHAKIAQGFKTVMMTYKAYSDLSQKLTEIAALWDQNKPDEPSVKKANRLLIIRTLKSSPFGSVSPCTLEASELFKAKREKHRESTVPEGNYLKDIHKRHEGSIQSRMASAVLPQAFESIKTLRACSSVIDHAEFRSALVSAKNKILGSNEETD
jgi:hypothetical protein